MALPADPADALAGPPELNDDDYIREVLGHPDPSTDAAIEQALVAKATALGIAIPAPRCPTTADEPGGSSGDESAGPGPRHGRTASTSSNSTTNTELTSRHSATFAAESTTTSRSPLARRRSKNLTFAHYEKYLSHLDPAFNQPKFAVTTTAATTQEQQTNNPATTTPAPAGKRKDVVADLKRSITTRFRRRKPPLPSSHTVPWNCCREDFPSSDPTLHPLPCGHTYCRSCLLILITQTLTDESKMPPRCCATPLSAALIQTVLPSPAAQHQFLLAVLQYSTPWASRLFCPSPACGAFIPPPGRPPAAAAEAVCKACKTRVCVTCKRAAHRRGQDCPEDWELEAVLKMGERSGWRRCYKCRNLVELAQGCSHMTCRCKAQFCYICGAVWEPSVGCPNFCNGEEELERRRVEELERLEEEEREKEEREEREKEERRAREEAEGRTRESAEWKAARGEMEAERARFEAFRARMGAVMRERQEGKRRALVERYDELVERMRERHAKTEQHLEDRQIEAEIELRAALEQSERSVRIQLRHMEAYCNVLSIPPDDPAEEEHMPSRQVTQKHLMQLKQQYRLRDGMERRHQAQINVLREKQAKRMEELVGRHAEQMAALRDRKEEEVEDLAVEFANDEEALTLVFDERKAALRRRWALAGEVLRAELEAKHGVPYGPMPLPEWDDEGLPVEEMEGLAVVVEEEETAPAEPKATPPVLGTEAGTECPLPMTVVATPVEAGN